jgi:glyoxylase-like metal-dependent hydrolase (beta-lactamase superfamily II)/rhodanese-related sulfurtransferase
MVFKQYYLNCLAHASYLIGDEQTGQAAIIDPQRDVDQYIDECRERNLQVRYVFLTHCHADFVAGHLELRDRTGACIYLGAKAEAEYEFTAMKEGDSLDFGGVRFRVLETPGHTVESICVLVYDLELGAEKPHAVLTGDTLFIGDVGRPDLQASVGYAAKDLAAMLYDSLREKLLTLPDETLVYPAHGAGSLCGRKMSKETVSTIGEQRRLNYALQPMGREEFVALVTADLPESPAYFGYDAVMNTKERATLDKTVEAALKPLNVDEVLALAKEGAQLLDTRDGGDFGRAHFAGSLNIGLGGQYATWAGTLLDREKPIILITEPGSEREAALRLGRIGFDHVAGYLEGGVEALEHRRELAVGWDRVGPPELAGYLESGVESFVLDVRNPGEFEAKRIDGAVNIPLNKLRARLAEVPRDRRLVVHCAGGYRSSIAASILQQAGIAEVEELSGGIAAWEAVGLPVVGAPA